MNDLLKGKQIGLSAPWLPGNRHVGEGFCLSLSRVAHASREGGSPKPFVMLTLESEPGIFAHSQGHCRFAWAVVFCKVAIRVSERVKSSCWWESSLRWGVEFPFFLLLNPSPAVKKPKLNVCDGIGPSAFLTSPRLYPWWRLWHPVSLDKPSCGGWGWWLQTCTLGTCVILLGSVTVIHLTKIKNINKMKYVYCLWGNKKEYVLRKWRFTVEFSTGVPLDPSPNFQGALGERYVLGKSPVLWLLNMSVLGFAG